MKNLKQTQLAFSPVPKKSDASSSTQKVSSASIQSTPRPPKAKTTSNQGRATMDHVEIPHPPKRRTHANPVSSAHSSRYSSTKSELSQAGKPSHKRKLSAVPDPVSDRSPEIVHLPRLQDASSSSVGNSVFSGQSLRNGPLLSIDNNLAAAEQRNGPAPHKKLRMSSPMSDLTPVPPSSAPDTDQDDFELIPTSQSDEIELVLPKDPAEVQKHVDTWRKETLPNSPSRAESPSADPFYSPYSELSEIPMDLDFNLPPESDAVPETPIVDAPPTNGLGLQYPHTPCSVNGMTIPDLSSSSLETSNSLWTTPVSHFQTPSRENGGRKLPLTETSPSNAFRSLTPPPSSPDSDTEPEQIVRALDVKSKTEMLIADIKARAQSAAHSSPEQSPIDLDALTDSDSDSSDSDDVKVIVNGNRNKGKGKTANTPAKAGPSIPTLQPSSRYNLRRASPSGSKRKPAPVPQVSKSRKVDPLDALLREKNREERTGTGMAAVRLAEETIARARADMRNEIDDEGHGSGSDMDWEYDHVVPARGVKGKGKSKVTKVGPSRTKVTRGNTEGDESDDDNAVAQMDYEEYLGKKEGEAVGKILANDLKEKIAKSLAKKTAEPLGVLLWASGKHNSAMVTVPALPIFAVDVRGSPALQMLKDATARNDINQVAALLTSGFVAFLHPDHWPVVMPWLLDTAFSNVNTLATLAYTQLLRLAPLLGNRTSGLRLSYVLSVLIRLGASSDVLRNHECTSGGGFLQRAAQHEWKDEMAYRLVTVIDAFAKTFVGEDLCGLLLVMLLVGMDPTAPEALRTDVRKTCDSLAQVMSPFQELSACKKLVAFGKTLSPMNQAFLTSFIPSVSPATTRMARYIARSLLMDTAPSDADYSDELADLLPLVKLLSPPPGSRGYFDIPGNGNTEGYYDALTCRLSLLSRVLSDIDKHVMMEKVVTQSAPKVKEETPEKEEEEKEKLTVLEQVTRKLDLLHGKIVDTRAAHLDRSRAKAALQRLSFRVHYQRQATLKSGEGTNRPRNLLGYFHNSS